MPFIKIWVFKVINTLEIVFLHKHTNTPMMFRMLFVFMMFLAIGTTLQGQKAIVEVDESLLELYQKQKEASYIVLLRDRQVFRESPQVRGKVAKSRIVYQSLVSKAAKTQQPVIDVLEKNKVRYQSFYVTNAIKVTSDLRVMMEIASMEQVAQIIDDAPFRMLDYTVERLDPGQRNGDAEWGIRMIKADSVWESGITGRGVVIAGQDTGYDWATSPLKQKYRGYDASGNYVHDYNWHDAIHENSPQYPENQINPCGYSVKEPCDDNNHGTHTMGTMVGQDSVNYIGVAPGASWIACRNMDRGWGRPSTYMECFEWFLAPYDFDKTKPDPAKAPHVINNSWYCSVEEGCNPSNFKLMEEIVLNLKSSGVVVVVSAGNEGSQGCGSVTGPPAFFEPSFSVGATNDQDVIAGFSSKGPVVIDSSFRLKPNVSAPGVAVRSVVKGGNYAAFSGTSMAGPHVAGAVALIIEANSALEGEVEIIEDILESTAVPKEWNQDCGGFAGSKIPNPAYGFGRIDALAAVKKAKSLVSAVSAEDLNPIQIYPNPAAGFFTISCIQRGEEIRNVELINQVGVAVTSMTYGGEQLVQIQTEGIGAGLYYYHVETSQGRYFGKMVITR